MSVFKKLWLLFINTFLISASTNGGYAIVSIMKTKFVEKYHWLKDEEMMDLMSIGQSIPGPIAINTSVLVGYRVAGIMGSIATLLGTVSPPLIIMCFVSVFYNMISGNVYVRTFMSYMQVGVAALLISVTIDILKGIYKTKNIYLYILCGLCFLVVRLTDVSIFYIALVCGIVGYLLNRYRNGKA